MSCAETVSAGRRANLAVAAVDVHDLVGAAIVEQLKTEAERAVRSGTATANAPSVVEAM